jgi:nicotinate-nucleotide pyrophosphorylase (carboxylating)
MALPEGFDIRAFVSRVLAEDLGDGGDLTSNATIAADARFTAEMNCRQRIVVAGLDLAAAFSGRSMPMSRSSCLQQTATLSCTGRH